MDEDALLQQALAMSMQVRLQMQSILTPLCFPVESPWLQR